jgi:hypothetical protein
VQPLLREADELTAMLTTGMKRLSPFRFVLRSLAVTVSLLSLFSSQFLVLSS